MSDATNGGGAAAKRSNPSRLWTLKGVQVLATGSHAPDQVVSNEQLAERLGFDADWIVQRTDIRQRRHAAAGEASSHIATEAARRCLEHAECPPDDVDLLLLATSTPDYICPATANLVQERLGLRCGAADMMAACAGFMYAMVTGQM